MSKEVDASDSTLDSSITPFCAFWLARKKRNCKMRVKQGAMYCAEHLPTISSVEDKRIPCPFDPAHSVYESKLKCHLKKCNARNPEVLPEYFHKDFNTTAQEGFNNKCFSGIPRIGCVPSSKLPSISDLVERIELVASKLDIPIISERHRQIEKIVISETEKHRIQQEALSRLILQNANKYERVVVCEFGAGKGGLSNYLWETFFRSKSIDCEFILIDRSNSRCKKDAKMRHEGAKIHRIFIDIKDLDLNALLSSFNSEKTYFLWISKHLCGTATCLTINALMKLRPTLRRGTFCVACCCHQCCLWRAYPNKKFLIESGVIVEEGEEEMERVFKMICSITSWAVCGFREKEIIKDAEDVEFDDDKSLSDKRIKLQDEEIFSDERKKTVGRLMKRILDHGRNLKLNDTFLDCELRHYVEEEVTLENAVLLGHFQ